MSITRISPWTLLAGFAAAAVTLLVAGQSAQADATGQIMARCRNHAHKELKIRFPDLDTKYEGQRADGTHAVSGIAFQDGKKRTFNCTLDKSGTEITEFHLDEAADAEALPHVDSVDVKVEGTEFNATGETPCARTKSQPMASCKLGVVRNGNGEGWVKIFWPDDSSRVIFFEKDTPVRYDETEADAGAKMHVDKVEDLFKVSIGEERFEIPEVVFTGD